MSNVCSVVFVVVELALPILACKSDSKRRSRRLTLHRLWLDTRRMLSSQLLAEIMVDPV